MKTIHLNRPRHLAFLLAASGCLCAGIALSGPAPSEQESAQPEETTVAIAAVRREVLDPLDAPLHLAAEREINRRLFSRVRIPETETPLPPPAFHSVEILVASASPTRLLAGETAVPLSRIPFRIHRVDPVAKVSEVVGTGYYDSLTGAVFLLDPEKNANVDPKKHPLLNGGLG